MLSNPDAIRNEILKIVAGQHYRPQKPRKFLTPLGLTSDDARPLRLLIREMVEKGELAYGKGHYVFPVIKADSAKDGTARAGMERSTMTDSSLPSENLVIGRFQRRPSGVGFVRPRYADDDSPVGDIFIPVFWTRDAASGDTVAI